MMKGSVYIDRKTYDNINCIAANNENEQMMVFGGVQDGDKVTIDSSTIKWFSRRELISQDSESVEVDEGVLVQTIMNILARGKCNSIVMVHSHPCATPLDDFLYGSLSSEDIVNSKRLLLICQFMNVKYFDGVSTGSHIYFWSLNNENIVPEQLSCYVDNVLVPSKVPGTIQELVDIVGKGAK